MQTQKSKFIINADVKKSELEVLLIQNKKQSFFLKNTLICLAIYFFTFFLLYYIKYNSLVLTEKYSEMFCFYFISLVVSSILSNKIFLTPKHDVIQSLRKIYISVSLSLGILTMILLFTDGHNLSRIVIIGSILIGGLLETIYFYFNTENKSLKRIVKSNRISYDYTILDFFLISVFIYLILLRNLAYPLHEKYIITIILIYVSWIFAAFFTHRFNPLKYSVNNWSAIGLQIKFYFLLISSTALVIFAFDIQDGKWEYFIESIISYSVTSFIMFLVLYARTLPYPTDEISNVFLRAFELENPESVITGEQHKINNKLVIDALPETQLKEKFKLQYFRDFPDVYRFLNRSLELNSFDETKTLVIRSSDSYNVEVLNKNSIQLLVNLHEINDLFRINDYFRIVNSKLIDGGVYSGCLIPIKNRYKTFQKKYPFLIASLFYFFDFIWRRVFPKIPLLRKIYFSLTKGKDRAISLTEALGRLVYCGFKIIDLTEIDEFVFFAANKIKEPSTDTNPSYSPIFKMRRIGKDGKQIFVYKIRTMHPYSEYLQEFVYERNKLTSGGKFKNDFRISSWGRILRKLWIDELPMIINLLKGELKLIGVRPVSNHYLSLYSIEFRQRRMKYKPGLFPPFYADMPKTIEEIEQSEKKYFDAYDKSHFKTDVKYFFRIIYNIIFKNKRSS